MISIINSGLIPTKLENKTRQKDKIKTNKSPNSRNEQDVYAEGRPGSQLLREMGKSFGITDLTSVILDADSLLEAHQAKMQACNNHNVIVRIFTSYVASIPQTQVKSAIFSINTLNSITNHELFLLYTKYYGLIIFRLCFLIVSYDFMVVSNFLRDCLHP